jgi:hypothetical protein
LRGKVQDFWPSPSDAVKARRYAKGLFYLEPKPLKKIHTRFRFSATTTCSFSPSIRWYHHTIRPFQCGSPIMVSSMGMTRTFWGPDSILVPCRPAISQNFGGGHKIECFYTVKLEGQKDAFSKCFRAIALKKTRVLTSLSSLGASWLLRYGCLGDAAPPFAALWRFGAWRWRRRRRRCSTRCRARARETWSGRPLPFAPAKNLDASAHGGRQNLGKEGAP